MATGKKTFMASSGYVELGSQKKQRALEQIGSPTTPARRAGSKTQSLRGCKAMGNGRRGRRGNGNNWSRRTPAGGSIRVFGQAHRSIDKAEADSAACTHEIRSSMRHRRFQPRVLRSVSGRIEEAKLRLRIAPSSFTRMSLTGDGRKSWGGYAGLDTTGSDEYCPVPWFSDQRNSA